MVPKNVLGVESKKAEEGFATRTMAAVVPNVPDVVTFNSDVEKTQELFETLREAGVVPCGETLSSMMDACTACMRPSGVTFSSLVDARAKQGASKNAEDTFG